MVSLDVTIRALGNKSGSFCEAVNCEQSEQEGKFLFATLWFSKRFEIPSFQNMQIYPPKKQRLVTRSCIESICLKNIWIKSAFKMVAMDV